MARTTQYDDEIRQQPGALVRLLVEGRDAVHQAASRIRAFDPAWVLIAARGSSDNAARYAQYLFGLRNQLGVGLAAPSLSTLYDTAPKMDRALVIGISQSGQSPDIVAVLDAARAQGAATLALSNEVESPLAKAAEDYVPLCAGRERAVAATKTYSNELLGLAMLSAALEADSAAWKAIEAVPSQVEAAIGMNRSLSDVAEDFRDVQQLAVVGRGLNYCTAFETALKIKETSYLMAEPYSTADLLHGPVAIVDEGFPVVVVAPSGRAIGDASALLDLLDERAARVIALSDREDILARAEGKLRLPAGVPEWLSPIVAITPGQLLAGAFASARGLDPDRPRGLSKVTKTR